MPEFMISGVPVMFPFEPYDVQRRYMEKVIECLDRSANSVLESPTGWFFFCLFFFSKSCIPSN